ncbi:MAG: methyltransferase [Paludibacter sp.]|jgi:tRNA1Val (adenine37-N6)-methyltransferase|nr:methyltransferase [Paludibacter sp.]
MANEYFSFKKFTVFQNRCAMKVGTDGVLLGAWANVENVNTILDIGTGTGLIALMLAQRSAAAITAIDIDNEAIMQANENFVNSDWANRLTAINISLQNYAKTTDNRFDLIVSNPPYFVNSLQNPDNQRSIARHAILLSQRELIFHSKTLLTPTGKLCVILPVEQTENCVKFADEMGLFCTKKIFVQPTITKTAKRILLEFSVNKQETIESKIYIETNQRGCYSEQFTALVRDFYLKL